MKRLFFVAAVLVALAAAGASAQSLLDNDAYRNALHLRDQAQAALAAGNYEQARQLSQQADDSAKQALQIAQGLALAYRASNYLDLAKQRSTYAASLKAQTQIPQAWQQAQGQLAVAQSDYNSKDYPSSITASEAVLDALKTLPESAGGAATPMAGTAVATAGTLPSQYTVRLLPNSRDCFWNIAGYPFVYGDPLEWPHLYQANKQVLQDPSNPNLIQPGQVFSIPPLHGEVRSGMWQPTAAAGN